MRDIFGEAESPIRVAVIDDESLVRSGLQMILDSAADIEVAVTCDGAEAVGAIAAARPDVVLLDLRMPVADGLSVLAELQREADPPKIAMLTTFDAEEHVADALSLGALGFLLKDTDPEELIHAVRRLASGVPILSPSITETVIEGYLAARPGHNRSVTALVDGLSERERAVLALIGEGLSNHEIGERLFLSVGTVKEHVRALLTKLGALNRVQAAVIAYQAGLVGIDPAG